MKFLSIIKKIIKSNKYLLKLWHKVLYKRELYIEKKNIINEVKKQPKQNAVYLFGCPNHANLGDNAQTYCTEQWIRKNYPGMEIVEICTYDVWNRDFLYIKLLKRHLKKNNIIILHSGYHTTDLYIWEERLNRAVVRYFHKQRILVLPQTVNFLNDAETDKSSAAYAKNNRVLFLARDSQSYIQAKELYRYAKVMLYPDIVTSLIGSYKSTQPRNGIMFCMRNDQEAYYSEDKIQAIRSKLERRYKTDITDTTIAESFDKIKSDREKYIYDKINELSRYKIVVTDRYHGTIFSLIANTPVIVVASSDHKLASGVDWFTEDKELKNRVFYCEDIDTIYELIDNIYTVQYDDIKESYYEHKYYDKLKDIFEMH